MPEGGGSPGTFTWAYTGSGEGDSRTPGNWQGGVAPGALDNLVFPGGTGGCELWLDAIGHLTIAADWCDSQTAARRTLKVKASTGLTAKITNIQNGNIECNGKPVYLASEGDTGQNFISDCNFIRGASGGTLRLGNVTVGGLSVTMNVPLLVDSGHTMMLSSGSRIVDYDEIYTFTVDGVLYAVNLEEQADIEMDVYGTGQIKVEASVYQTVLKLHRKCEMRGDNSVYPTIWVKSHLTDETKYATLWCAGSKSTGYGAFASAGLIVQTDSPIVDITQNSMLRCEEGFYLDGGLLAAHAGSTTGDMDAYAIGAWCLRNSSVHLDTNSTFGRAYEGKFNMNVEGDIRLDRCAFQTYVWTGGPRCSRLQTESGYDVVVVDEGTGSNTVQVAGYSASPSNNATFAYVRAVGGSLTIESGAAPTITTSASQWSAQSDADELLVEWN